VSYPGLADPDNWKDRMLVSVLAEKTPFLKEFGQVCDAWKNMVEYLNTQRINGDELVYEKGISLDTVQRHWKLYIAVQQQCLIHTKNE
jgi:hypothetical protein